MLKPTAGLALLLIACAAGAHSQSAPPLAIVGVNVVDVVSGQAVAGRTVLIRDGRIEAVGDASIAVPPEVRRFDAEGRYLIPGLWDAHAHLSWAGSGALPVLLAHGVTGVRDLGGRLAEIDRWRDEIRLGAISGPPRILRSGPILNDQVFNPLQLGVTTPEAGRGAVAALRHVGVDFVKVHRRTQREVYFAILDQAKSLGLPLVGHVPMTVYPAEAAEAGQASFEHTETLFEGTFARDLAPGELPVAIERFLASEDADRLWSTLRDRGTVVVPTLVAYRSVLDVIRWVHEPDRATRWVAASELASALGRAAAATPQEIEYITALQRALVAATASMHRAGVKLLAGSDLAGPRVPGRTLHEELQLLVDAGLTPSEALASATVETARFLGLGSESGTVEAGKLADLVLLDADPLADIANIRRISAVVANGRLYRRSELDGLLEEGARLAEGN